MQQHDNIVGLLYTGIVLAAATVFAWSVISAWMSPLRKYPGPFLGGTTNIWRLYQVWTQKYQWTIENLHKKHGPVIRIGPNLLDLDYPELIKVSYGTDERWLKTQFYSSSSSVVNGKIVYNVFSIRDPVGHARLKKPIAKYYSMSNVLAMEGQVDRMISKLCKQIDRRFAQDNEPFGLGEWLSFYAWDSISCITFSEPYGYMDTGYDLDETILKSGRAVDYFARVGQMPFLDSLLLKNPIMPVGPGSPDAVNDLCFRRLRERIDDRKQGRKPDLQDFLDSFLDAVDENPEAVDLRMALGYTIGNMTAGADTTSATLCFVMEFLLRSPNAMKRLEDDLLAQDINNDDPVSYKIARSIPYLDAVIRESMRLQPAIPMPLERYVPDTGLTLPDGTFVPPGTAVEISPYIIGRNKTLWGEDADEFRPERWFKADDEDEESYQQRLRKMHAADLTFGDGARICIGRHVALVQIYKVVATLVMRYEMELEDPEKKMDIVSGWFVRQSGLVVNARKRS